MPGPGRSFSKILKEPKNGEVPSNRAQKPHKKDFICGCGAALAEVLITYPLHKISFRQQLHGILAQEAFGQLSSEGARFLYRGILPPLLHKTASRSLMFGTYEEYQRLLSCSGNVNFSRKHAFAAFLAGSTEALLCPLERVQVLLQTAKYHDQLRNTAHSFVELRPYGLKEFYRGLSPILLRNGLSNVLFFGLRKPIKSCLVSPDSDSQLAVMAGDLVSGGLLGASLSTLFYPVNVVKTRMQTVLGGEFTGIRATFITIWRERDRSLTQLFRGVHINFTRSILTWGIINATFEFLQKHLFTHS